MSRDDVKAQGHKCSLNPTKLGEGCYSLQSLIRFLLERSASQSLDASIGLTLWRSQIDMKRIAIYRSIFFGWSSKRPWKVWIITLASWLLHECLEFFVLVLRCWAASTIFHLRYKAKQLLGLSSEVHYGNEFDVFVTSAGLSIFVLRLHRIHCCLQFYSSCCSESA